MQLIGKKYADMPEEYRNKVDQATFKARRKAQRKAGDAIGDIGLEGFKSGQFDIESLDDFDFRAVGAGGTAGRGSKNLDDDDDSNDIFGRGKARFSKFDAKGLLDTGKFTAQELYDYGMANDGKNDFVFGNKTQNYLSKLLDGGKPGDPNDPGDPSDPEDPPYTTLPVPVNPNPPASVVQNPIQDIDISFGNIKGDGNTQSVGDITQNTSYTDNSVSYGNDERNFTYSTGGNMIAEPFDVDTQSPTGSRFTPNSKQFMDMFRNTLMDSIKRG